MKLGVILAVTASASRIRREDDDAQCAATDGAFQGLCSMNQECLNLCQQV